MRVAVCATIALFLLWRIRYTDRVAMETAYTEVGEFCFMRDHE